MAQRDKVKELVGRGLNSYHTKALQQVDRIEKKNKEQNHKISILSNELDNDYLTKTEEGSVISLEHSKEGMVYLDELQGNTLVNYCTDGSKELTLNGDIDVEGTFVTTTEGVDNGKVDVMCEGNTLVNLVKTLGEKTFISRNFELLHSKVNTVYTVLLDIKLTSEVYVGFLNSNGSWSGSAKTLTTSGSYILNFTPIDEDVKFRINGASTQVTVDKLIVLEGNYTNISVPQVHFEGMKSVGQDDENGHKIEILSQSSYPNLIKKSKNLSGNGSGSDTSNQNGVQYLIEDNVEFARVSANQQDFSNFYWWLQTVEPRKKGETYTISYDYRCTSDWGGYWYPSESYSGSFFPSTNGEWRRMKITRTVTGGDAKGNMLFGVSIRGTEIGDYIDIKNVKMEKGTNNSKWIPSVMDEEFLLAKYSNKKEILMNEPLRSLPNGVCDRVVKINNKYFIERNCREIIIDGSINWNKVKDSSKVLTTVFYTRDIVGVNLGTSNTKLATPVLSLQFPYANNDIGQTKTDIEGIYTAFDGNLCISIAKAKLSSDDSSGLKSWLQSNPVKAVYQLATPTYEPLEVEPVLNTYNDVTHISNNSIIPCNMKIKNTGYNAIIKPSTLYTVALDTNKSGTVGIDLGGMKTVTTNNVATITTPAILSDDSLRLFGKGIKGSKVRLLEGDKTNWIPSFFEGMKSSFEDKVQSDGSYKMEILMNNENLFDINTYKNGSANIEFKNHGFRLYTTKPMTYANAVFKTKVKPYTDYRLYADVRTTSGHALADCYDLSNKWFANTMTKFNTKNNTELSMRFYCSSNIEVIGDVEFTNIRLVEIGHNTDFVEFESNKIQFSSIEPLRKIDDTLKDKFIFKDGKLMIERNCIEKTFDGSETWNNDGEIKNGYLCCFVDNTLTNMKDYSKRAFKCNVLPYEGTKRFTYQQATRSGAGFLEFILKVNTNSEFRQKISELRPTVIVGLEEPIYEEIPFELQKIILEGYENGTLFFDTNIPPTSTVTYAGETPIVKSVKLNKTEVSSNTEDINDNIIPYLMDMDYRVVMLQLATEELEGGVSMARLFGGTYEMIKRDILSKRLTREEYGYRLADYFNAGKLTEEQVRELEDLR